MLAFLRNANVYTNVSVIAKLKVQDSYPKIIANNFVLSGLADKLLDAVITPGLVERAAKPALILSVQFAQAPTDIVDNKVVVATAPYKQQVMQTVADFGLPKFLVVNAGLVIDAIPSQLTLVNLQKHPNSIMGIIIKARTLLHYNKTALHIAWIVEVAAMLILIIHNLHRIRILVLAIGVAKGIAGGLVVVLFYLKLWIMDMMLSGSSNALVLAQNKLVIDAASYVLLQMRNIAVVDLIIAAIFLLLWWFVHFDKLQSKVDKKLKKWHLHVPTVTVKVK